MYLIFTIFAVIFTTIFKLIYFSYKKITIYFFQCGSKWKALNNCILKWTSSGPYRGRVCGPQLASPVTKSCHLQILKFKGKWKEDGSSSPRLPQGPVLQTWVLGLLVGRIVLTENTLKVLLYRSVIWPELLIVK